MSQLNTPLSKLSNIQPRHLKLLARQGLSTVEDFLFYFPFRYEDYTAHKDIRDAKVDDVITLEGIILEAKEIKTWKKKMRITEATLEDRTGTINLIWYGQAYITSTVKGGEKVRVSGKISLDNNTLVIQNPAFERASRIPTNTGCLVPVYKETKGLTSRWIRWQMQTNLRKYGYLVENVIPKQIRDELKLADKSEAVKEIHFPADRKKLELAQKTIAFENMFLVQLKAAQIKINWDNQNSIKIPFTEKLIKNFVKSLPFKLTNAQRKASFEILQDLEKDQPMNRLLEGDVGSGKTIVAAIAMLQTISQNFQVALMAPTEILAKQHFENLREIFKKYNINISLLTNSYKLVSHPKNFEIENWKLIGNWKLKIGNSARSTTSVTRQKLLKANKENAVQLTVGTHSIIQKDVSFKNLALVVVDEQHRFGVSQRAALQQSLANPHGSALVPHLLSMTATPIPRTLALAYFGNLDISTLDEMPKGRIKIITKIVGPNGKEKAYEFIKTELRKGRQVFMVYPLISESESLKDIKAAETEYEKLAQKHFPEYKVALVHGRLKPKEKEQIMADFRDKKIDILVSTTVIEVGIDIPNATVMAIENSERFGLAQLHQLRGRVGRGKHQSYCFLFANTDSQKASERLKALRQTDDGFKLAQIDLELRGPGQFFGTEQSGLPDFAMQNLGDVRLIKEARLQANRITRFNPKLSKFPQIKNALAKFEQEVHLE